MKNSIITLADMQTKFNNVNDALTGVRDNLNYALVLAERVMDNNDVTDGMAAAFGNFSVSAEEWLEKADSMNTITSAPMGEYLDHRVGDDSVELFDAIPEVNPMPFADAEDGETDYWDFIFRTGLLEYEPTGDDEVDEDYAPKDFSYMEQVENCNRAYKYALDVMTSLSAAEYEGVWAKLGDGVKRLADSFPSNEFKEFITACGA